MGVWSQKEINQAIDNVKAGNATGAEKALVRMTGAYPGAFGNLFKSDKGFTRAESMGA